jgi:hypothetical protein
MCSPCPFRNVHPVLDNYVIYSTYVRTLRTFPNPSIQFCAYYHTGYCNVQVALYDKLRILGTVFEHVFVDTRFLVFKLTAHTRERTLKYIQLRVVQIQFDSFIRLTSSSPHSLNPEFTSQHHTQSDHRSMSKDNCVGRSYATCGVLLDAELSRRTRQSSNQLGQYMCGKKTSAIKE